MDKRELQGLYVEIMRAKEGKDAIGLAFALERLGKILFDDVAQYEALRRLMAEE